MNTTTLKRYVTARFGRFFGFLHDSLAMVGLAALLVLAVQAGRVWHPLAMRPYLSRGERGRERVEKRRAVRRPCFGA